MPYEKSHTGWSVFSTHCPLSTGPDTFRPDGDSDAQPRSQARTRTVSPPSGPVGPPS